MDTLKKNDLVTRLRPVWRALSLVFVNLLLFLIKFYRYCVSPLLGANCRFYPTCSGYAMEALQKHGLVKGVLLTIRRVCRCHPWGGQGYDPVPLVSPLKQGR